MTSDEIYDYLEKTGNPYLKLLLGTLKISGSRPEIKADESLKSYGNYNNIKDLLRYNPNIGANIPTFVHELTHAADKRMADYAYEREKGDFRSLVNPEFKKVYDYLYPTDSNLPLIKENKNKGKYRYNAQELQAHGVENTTNNKPFLDRLNPVGGHVDPTMATEFYILEDLYRRHKQK